MKKELKNIYKQFTGTTYPDPELIKMMSYLNYEELKSEDGYFYHCLAWELFWSGIKKRKPPLNLLPIKVLKHPSESLKQKNSRVLMRILTQHREIEEFLNLEISLPNKFITGIIVLNNLQHLDIYKNHINKYWLDYANMQELYIKNFKFNEIFEELECVKNMKFEKVLNQFVVKQKKSAKPGPKKETYIYYLAEIFFDLLTKNKNRDGFTMQKTYDDAIRIGNEKYGKLVSSDLLRKFLYELVCCVPRWENEKEKFTRQTNFIKTLSQNEFDEAIEKHKNHYI